jgi:hypothetical protein
MTKPVSLQKSLKLESLAVFGMTLETILLRVISVRAHSRTKSLAKNAVMIGIKKNGVFSDATRVLRLVGDPGIIITPAILLKGKNEELFHAVGMAEKRLCVVKLEIIASRKKTYVFVVVLRRENFASLIQLD